MSSFPQVDFQINWRPFFLNPAQDAPKEGEDKLVMYNRKFGAQRIAQMLPRMTQVFAGLGITYSMGGRTGNTIDSHRLITWAGRQGLAQQDRVVEALFDAYFSREQFLGDRAVLLDAAAKAGLDPAAAAAVVDDPNALLAEVREEVARYGRGVTGVPFFIIAGSVRLSGALPPEEFEDAITS
eukprot:CAMPEP_0172159772 /NCGR_PEP_ID=MMETSP1050-20130122/5167_1 /TAXON_ID=233186 /ORGANISM="Cryptomonas curvata, Strain CCAP979/52" /LENGTH=181 /DNA_ID=CAMNT_0012829419 /DNA_START=192 /DNA_END=734 /DNA_ORIENTATION=+